MKPARTVPILIAVALLVGASLFAYQLSTRSVSPPAGRPGGSEPFTVSTAVVQRHNLSRSIRLSGDIEPAQSTAVNADIAGTVDRVLIASGSAVAKGEVIAYVDPSRPGVRYELGPVRSTVDGWVTAIHVDPGNHVVATTPVATVATLDRLHIKITVPERYATQPVTGMTVAFTATAVSGRTLEAIVIALDPVLDPATRSRGMTLLVPRGSSPLQPGMRVSLDVPTQVANDTVAVPFSALVQDGGNEYVYVVENGLAVRRPVQSGLIVSDHAQIAAGLEVGEMVITDGVHKVRAGDPVRTLAPPEADVSRPEARR